MMYCKFAAWVRRLVAPMALAACGLAWADPPDRVGRLTEVSGHVWVYAPENGEWIEAVRNRPLTGRDRLSTEGDGRAEVYIGSTLLRLNNNTELEFHQLDDDRISVQLHTGGVAVRLRSREAAKQFDLSTNEGHFLPEVGGHYRFDRADDVSHVTALSGQLQFEGEGLSFYVQPGQRVDFWRDGITRHAIGAPQYDAFSNWLAQRESREPRSVANQYVSPEMTGAEDLDRYGRWEQSADYGAVWIPSAVAPGWAPYRMGHWAWVSPWGWTWVDDAPWGFAPFHYGRWVWLHNNWCWTPGRYVARPVYAPALVAWVGAGNGGAVLVAGGAVPTVGWFPLGPHEVYVPGYRVSSRYVRQINDNHVRDRNEIDRVINRPGTAFENTRYVNRDVHPTVTVVPATVIERRQPVAGAITAVDGRWLREAKEHPRADAPVPMPAPRHVPDGRRVDAPRTVPTPIGMAPPPVVSGRHDHEREAPRVVPPPQQQPAVATPFLGRHPVQAAPPSAPAETPRVAPTPAQRALIRAPSPPVVVPPSPPAAPPHPRAPEAPRGVVVPPPAPTHEAAPPQPRPHEGRREENKREEKREERRDEKRDEKRSERHPGHEGRHEAHVDSRVRVAANVHRER